MVRFQNIKQFESCDAKLLRQFTRFVMDKFLDAETQKKLNVTVKFKDRLRDGNNGEIQSFTQNKYTIKILINKKSGSAVDRLREMLYVLGHELVHLKQYALKETIDHKTGCFYKGRKYKESNDKTSYYWTSPWEREAYGWERGLVELFTEYVLQE